MKSADCGAALLGLWLAFYSQETSKQTIERLIANLGSESIESRERAQAAIQDKWRTWSETDLRKLSEAGGSKNADLAVRARSALTRINQFRRIPDDIWKEIPDLERTLIKSQPAELVGLFDDLKNRLDEGSIGISGALLLCFEYVEDDRPFSEVKGILNPDPKSVGASARDLVADLVPILTGMTSREQLLRWWKTYEKKPQIEWHLAALEHNDDSIRAKAVERLARLKAPSVFPELLKAIGKIRDEEKLRWAMSHLDVIPESERKASLSPYLNDVRFGVRLEAAQLLFPVLELDSLKAVMTALERPEEMSSDPRHLTSLGEALRWLLNTRRKSAVDFVLGCLKSQYLEIKMSAILQVSILMDSSAEPALAAACQDPEQEFGITRDHIADARVCDWAAIRLARRLGVKRSFEWSDVLRERDKNIQEILTQWSVRQGSKAIPFLGPGVTPADNSQVEAILSEALSGNSDKFEAAMRRLSALGPDAWSKLERRIDSASELEKSTLQPVLSRWSNALLSVRPRSADAIPMARELEERIYKEFDADWFVSSIMTKWLREPSMARVEVVIMRGSLGRGVAVSLYAAAHTGKPSGNTRVVCESWRGFQLESRDIGLDEGAFVRDIKVQLTPLLDCMKSGPDAQSRVSFTLRKVSSKSD